MFKELKVNKYAIGFFLVSVFIGVFFKDLYARYSASPVTEMNTEKHFINVETDIVLYTTSWCPLCKQAKIFLHNSGFTFTERDIEANLENHTIFKDLNRNGVPQIVFRDKVLHGFNIEILSEELATLGSENAK